ncbi:MAG: translation initiation factor IF-3, partial [Butyrivibrio sp.]|nr:translation initiation factor IF-3 [Butyrivibrio sp.]
MHFFYLSEGKTISELFINDQIRAKEVRVIGIDGEQLGVMPIQEARNIADEEGVDLVMIAPTAKPPVCRVVDYGKFKYEHSENSNVNRFFFFSVGKWSEYC